MTAVSRSPASRARMLAFLATVAHAAFALPGAAIASDHIDSPTIAQDRGSDIADVYAFVDPNDRSQVVLILSTQGFIVSGEHLGMPIFDHNIRYRFEIENTGDARPDRFVDVQYSPGLGRERTQTARITLPNGRTFTAQTTRSTHDDQPPPIVVTTDPVSRARFYGGNAEDPFFLDDTGANRVVISILEGRPDLSLLGERGRDTYAGFNTLITAVRVPAALLKGKGNVIGVNGVTQRRRTQTVNDQGAVTGTGPWLTVDRQGTPLVNNGLIPPRRKNAYNGASTQEDANGRFRYSIVQSLQAAGTNPRFIAKILAASVNNGDILRLDLTVPNRGPQGGANPDGGFGNLGGRRLRDDVVDATFTLINNGRPIGDRVDANEVPFRNRFPFVAFPHQPFPPGDNPEDLTRQ